MAQTKILIVDDDVDLVDAIKLVLESKGYEVSAAYNRPDGVKAVSTYHPDVIILDVMMEEADDGFTAAQELRKQGIKTPILMLTSVSKVTGFAFSKDSELVPVNAFEEKPIKPEKLLARIKELLGNK